MKYKRIIIAALSITFIVLTSFVSLTEERMVESMSVTAVCSAPSNQVNQDLTFSSYFSGLFSSANWPARWNCGEWTPFEGWFYILSDLLIFLAYMSIPFLLLFYLRERELGIFKPLTIAFICFIFFCGLTHLIDAIIFWEPIYRLSGFVRFITGVVSIATVGLMVRVLPSALKYKSPEKLEKEVQEAVVELSIMSDALNETSRIARLGTWYYDIVKNETFLSDTVYDILEVERGSEIPVEEGFKFYHPDHRPMIQKAVENAINKRESYDLELKIISGKGKEKWIRTIGKPKIKNGKVVELHGLFQDIDDQVRKRDFIQQASDEIANLNKILIDSAKIGRMGIWEYDPKEKHPVWSEMVYDIHEVERGEKIPIQEAINFYHPDHREIIQKAVDEAISKNQGWDLELKIITAKGNERWVRAIGHAVLEDGKLVKLVGWFQDIENRKREQENLKLLNLRLTLARDAAEMGIWEWDVVNNVLSWDRNMFKLYGITESDFDNVYEAWLSGLHPDDKERTHNEVLESLKTSKRFKSTFRVVHPDGSIHYIKGAGSVLADDQGNPKQMIGINWDVTEQVENEERIRNINQELKERVNERTQALQEANKELESFSYSVSHDLRAPLRAINGYSEALSEDYADQLPEDAAFYIERIASNSIKMGALIDDLLEFSRLNDKKVNFQPLDTSQLVDEIIHDLFENRLDKIQKDNLPSIIGDHEMIKQVFSNLLDNAIKYSSKNPNQKISVSSKEEPDAFVISFSDNGVGFNMDYYEKLFQVFQRLHGEEDFEGTGIGLSLCKRIMDAHDGEIWAESVEGKGSTFYLRFFKNTENAK